MSNAVWGHGYRAAQKGAEAGRKMAGTKGAIVGGAVGLVVGATVAVFYFLTGKKKK